MISVVWTMLYLLQNYTVPQIRKTFKITGTSPRHKKLNNFLCVFLWRIKCVLQSSTLIFDKNKASGIGIIGCHGNTLVTIQGSTLCSIQGLLCNVTSSIQIALTHWCLGDSDVILKMQF